MAVKGDRVPTEHDERGAGVMQREKEVPKIFRELDHCSCQGTNLHGIVARV